nr:hypothetical protein [Chloroflexota bacterium]
MQCTIGLTNRQRRWGAVVHTIAVLGLVVLPLLTGTPLESIGGWLACPPQVIPLAGERRKHRRGSCHCGFAWRVGWYWMRRSWVVAAVRSEALLALVCLTGRQEGEWLCLLPWVAWLWKGMGMAWPRLGRQPLYEGMGRLWERASGLALLGLGIVWLGERLPASGGHRIGGLGYGLGALPVGLCLQHRVGEPQVEVERDEEGVYHVQLRGEFALHVDGNVAFYTRMLIIFLGLLEVPDETRASRRTRDGRTPFVRQERMAAWFGVPQPVISRWFDYWLQQEWRRMLSQRWGEVLAQEVQRRVIESWVKFPWWSAGQVWQHLRAQRSTITRNQVKQIGQESGWTLLRQQLREQYAISAQSFRPRDEWLVEQLLGQVQQLVEQLEA